MNSAQHLIIVAKTRLIPVEMFARGRWVVVEMTDDRAAIDAKFKALQRFANTYRTMGKPLVEVVVFASDKSDIGKVSVVGLHNAKGPPKLSDVFATERVVRETFWRNVYARIGAQYEPPVAHYDAIAAERLFISETANARSAARKPVWMRLEYWGAAVAALLVLGFTGAWFLETSKTGGTAPVVEEQTIAEDEDAPRLMTKTERMSNLAAYFSQDDN